MSIETLNFRVGENTGILLANIAQEHVMYNFDVDKALRVFQNSFGENCPQEIILDLLTGERLILVDEEEQMFNVVFRKDYPQLENIYPKFNISEWVNKNQEETDNYCKELEIVIDTIISEFRHKNYYNISFKVKSIIDFIQGREEGVLEDLYDDEELTRLSDVIRVIKLYFEKFVKITSTIEKLSKIYNKEFKFENYKVLEVLWKFKKFLSAEFHSIPELSNDNDLSNFIESQHEINKIEEEGIKPCNILDNYDAGWLAQDGTYYGLNGEIANMLHIQIANMLQKQGIIPEDNEDGINPDRWLEVNGWVKQHGNWILYDAYNNEKFDEENIPLSNEQITAIYNFGVECCQHVLKIGYKMKRITPNMFASIEPLMMKKLFDF